MPSVTVELLNIEGTEPALGWAGSHTVVVDRPSGKAGGLGLGFNGAELLGLTIGGCFCNDLRYVAHELGVEIARIEISVGVTLEGDPIMATAAEMRVTCEMADGSDPSPLIDRAKSITMASNSIRRGIPVEIRSAS